MFETQKKESRFLQGKKGMQSQRKSTNRLDKKMSKQKSLVLSMNW